MVSCGSPQPQLYDDIEYRDVREPSGDTSHLEGDVEDITDDPENFVARIQQSIKKVWDSAQECKSSTPDIPLSPLDLGFTLIGRKNPFSVGRECIIQRLEEASTRLCDGQRSIYDAYQAYNRGYDERSDRIVRAYENTLRMEDNFREQLLDFADTYYDRADRTSDEVIQGEYEAIAIIFENEGSFECADRIDNYERIRQRNSRRRR